jgi:hypothetical protein
MKIEIKKNYSQEEIAEFFDFPKFEDVPLRHMVQTHRLLLIQIPSVESKLLKSGIALPGGIISAGDENPYVVFSKSSDIPTDPNGRNIEVGDVVMISPHMQGVTFEYNMRGFMLMYFADILMFIAFEDFMKLRMKNAILNKKPDSQPGN